MPRCVEHCRASKVAHQRALATIRAALVLVVQSVLWLGLSHATEPQWKSPRGRGATNAAAGTTSREVAAHLAQAMEQSDDQADMSSADEGGTARDDAEDLPAPTPAPRRMTTPRSSPNVSPQWMPDRGAGPPPADYGSLSGQFQPAPTDAYGQEYSDDFGEAAYGDEFGADAVDYGMGAGFQPLRNVWRRFNAKHNVPLLGQSWRYRPFSLSGFVGGMFGDDMQDRHLEQQASVVAGWRAGWDMGAYIGGEVRSWYSNPATKFHPATNDQLEAHLFALDVDVLYYPWGETRLRPYFMAGVGFVDVVYHDQPTTKVDDMMLTLPFGVGVKYRLDNRFVLRSEFIDNFSLQGSVTDDMHNLAITMGLEVRFGGGDRRSYYPWNPQLSAW